MGNIGLARIALLAAVRSFGKDIGLADEGYFVRLEIAETVDENAESRLFMRPSLHTLPSARYVLNAVRSDCV
jgi:hypothetical protein